MKIAVYRFIYKNLFYIIAKSVCLIYNITNNKAKEQQHENKIGIYLLGMRVFVT